MRSGWHRRAGPATGWSDHDERRAGAGRGVRPAGGRAAPGRRLVPVGPVPQRAPVGHRPRGLQRRRRRVGLPSPTTTPARAPTAGARTAWPASATSSSGCASALALWNGRDPILKERMFGLTGAEGNHGEDVKEYWWYLDAVPSHAWNRWRYHYPQARVPVRRPGRRERPAGQARPGVRAARHRRVRRGPLLDRRGRLRQGRPDRPADDGPGHQRRPRAEPRCTCCRRCGSATRGRGTLDAAEAAAAGRPDGVGRHRPPVPRRAGAAGRRRARTAPPRSRCSARTRPTPRACSASRRPDAVPEGRHQRPRRRAARRRSTRTGRARRRRCWYQARRSRPARPSSCGCGCVRPAPSRPAAAALGDDFDEVVAQRRAEADEFYAELTPAGALGRRGDGHAPGLRRDAVEQAALRLRRRALAGRRPDPAAAAGVAGSTGRNARWRNFDAFDIMSMPDKWEYPWFAAWDLAFHCVALAHVDPAFAKYQLLLLCREWFQHPNGALPAYEWDFGDVNPPVQAWAALEVFAIDGARDLDFLSRIFDKLLVNFTWWVNREDADGSNLFEGGFLGLDNIGPLDRSHLPGRRQRSSSPTPPAGWRSTRWPWARSPSILNRSGSARRPTSCSSSSSTSPPSARRWSTSGVWDDDRRPVLRQAGHPGRHRRCRSRSARWSASSRCSPPSSSTRTVLARSETARQAVRPAARRARPRRPGAARRARPAARRARRPAAAARRRRRRPAAAAVRQAVRRGRVPVALRPAGPVRLPPRAPVRARRRGHLGHDRLRAGRVDHGDVRRQLQLAGPDVVPAQLPRRQRARALPPVLRRRLDDRVPDRAAARC